MLHLVCVYVVSWKCGKTHLEVDVSTSQLTFFKTLCNYVLCLTSSFVKFVSMPVANDEFIPFIIIIFLYLLNASTEIKRFIKGRLVISHSLKTKTSKGLNIFWVLWFLQLCQLCLYQWLCEPYMKLILPNSLVCGHHEGFALSHIISYNISKQFLKKL